MSNDTLVLTIDERGVATLTVNRPQVHNAFDDRLVQQLQQALDVVDADSEVRALVLRGEGKNFSAGADLNWMRRMADYSQDENLADARQLARMLQRLNTLSKPTIARVQGRVFGGGVGLVSCCDLALAAEDSSFALSEVRLGLIPAVISPYVIAAVGQRAARRYMLTGEQFSAAVALRLGLLHEVAPAARLDSAVDEVLESLLSCGPQAVAEAKSLILAVSQRPIDEQVVEDTARRITRVRASDEGREGVGAFLQKRSPAWLDGTRS